MPNDTPQIIDNTTDSRFELTQDSHLAELVYRLNGKRLVLIHVGVPDALSGQGLGGQLVGAAVDRAVRDGLTVVPLCPFARSWLERNRDTAARVAIDMGNDQAG